MYTVMKKNINACIGKNLVIESHGKVIAYGGKTSLYSKYHIIMLGRSQTILLLLIFTFDRDWTFFSHVS